MVFISTRLFLERKFSYWSEFGKTFFFDSGLNIFETELPLAELSYLAQAEGLDSPSRSLFQYARLRRVADTGSPGRRRTRNGVSAGPRQQDHARRGRLPRLAGGRATAGPGRLTAALRALDGAAATAGAGR